MGELVCPLVTFPVDAIGRQVHLVSVGVEQEPFWPLLFRDEQQDRSLFSCFVLRQGFGQEQGPQEFQSSDSFLGAPLV